MDEQLFDKLLDELVMHVDAVKMIMLYWRGEPLLDKHLVEHIASLKKIGISVVDFSTNGALLSDELTVKLLDAGLDIIRISCETLDEKNYEKIRVGLDFNTVMDNIRNLIRRRNQINPHMQIRIRGVDMPELTKEEVDSWVDYWCSQLKSNDEVDILPLHNWGNKIDMGNGENISKPCVIPFTTMVVGKDGIVPLCCEDSSHNYVLGNVNDQTIEEIWHSDARKRLLTKHAEGKKNDIPMCKTCTAWYRAPKRYKGLRI